MADTVRAFLAFEIPEPVKDEIASSRELLRSRLPRARWVAGDVLIDLDQEGRVLMGGKHLLTGSVELEWPIRGKWFASVFVDGGNALDSLSDELEFSAGAGIRWLARGVGRAPPPPV